MGTLLGGVLIKRFGTRTVLSCATVLIGLLTATLLTVDAATGGRWMVSPTIYGRFRPGLVSAVYFMCCSCSGAIDLIRVLIPGEIVDGEVDKLRKMDPLVSRACWRWRQVETDF
ncbi:hypothetical protein GMORB2_4002 [Geosmithia morbida]|uniref:Uncharacterized protein n=1 Tax=Geosmithia morbida TaxID=1094350 RepID=A0A9P5D2K0_9HYPO|nr:uncharacterized protein GMORB2_4002 [Geosmithia morbida]KAF4125163.1 hypothetical protein GMORB2_4002 [Geosmithia morbida]